MTTRRSTLFGLATLATSGLTSCSLIKRAESLDGGAIAAAPPPPPAAPPPPAPAAAGSLAGVPTRINGPTRTAYNTGRVAGPYIALTFDDGPDPEDTPRLLNILKARNVKATFFVIGRNVRAHPRIVERTRAEGHEVANHSQTHPALSKLGDAAVARELNGCSNAIADVLGGERPQVFRPPYGAFTARQKEWAHREFGLPSIMWSVDPLDWKIRNSAHVSNALIRGASNGGILLAHDIHPTTVAAIPSVVDTLLGKGYQFVTMGQLINMENGAGAPSPMVMRFTAGSL